MEGARAFRNCNPLPLQLRRCFCLVFVQFLFIKAQPPDDTAMIILIPGLENMCVHRELLMACCDCYLRGIILLEIQLFKVYTQSAGL